MGYKIMQGLGRLVYKEFGVILNEMKNGILLSREVNVARQAIIFTTVFLKEVTF